VPGEPAGRSVPTESRKRARAAGGMSARLRYTVTTVPVEPTITSRRLDYSWRSRSRAAISAAKMLSVSGQGGSLVSTYWQSTSLHWT
jgi:hypothetical protein